MNEDLDEKFDDFLQQNNEFYEDCDNEFEPMDELCEEENALSIFEPRDEISKTNMNTFEPWEYECKKNNSDKKHHQSSSIERFINKFKIITNIYHGKYKGMCAYCNLDNKFLHTIDFHHSDPSIKEITWKNRRNKDWKETMELFEKEKVIPLCGNCHSREQADLFNNYREIIIKKNLFEKSAYQIDKLIHDKIKDHEAQYNRNIKFRIVEWLKKRSVIEQLYDGKCVGCNKITVENNLPALQFHHRSERKEVENKFKWHKIKKYDIKTISKELIKEDCVCLCANCHKTVHFKNFKLSDISILGNDYKREVDNYKYGIQQNIQKFELKLTAVNNPLGKGYGYGEAWKKYLLHISKLSTEGKRIKTLNIAKSVGVNSRNVRKNILILLNKGFIRIDGENNNRTIYLTKKGREESNKM